MSEPINSSRRTFLKVSAALGGGLMLGLYLPGCSRGDDYPKPENTFTPNAWIRIGFDNTITFMIERAEMGQGVITSLSMILAEELEVALDAIQTEFAIARSGMGSTGGSNSIRLAWEPLRVAGASAREMLTQAAADTWQVPVNECKTDKGQVLHPASGRSVVYGEVAALAATYPVPDDVALKKPADYRLIGQPTTTLDSLGKVKGEVVFGMDMVIPGMKIAVLARPPVFGAEVKSFDDSQAKTVAGVYQIVAVDAGVAVIADSFPIALKARDLLQIRWSKTADAKQDDQAIATLYRQGLAEDGEEEIDRGDVDAVLKRSSSVIQTIYETPFLAHAPMEPMNCTIDLKADGCEVWVPTQHQSAAIDAVKSVTGLSKRNIKIHPTFIGGGFGRRLKVDYVTEAATIAKATDVPIKLMGTLKESIQGGFYRPANMGELKGVVEDGKLSALSASFIGPRSATTGVDIPYDIPNLRYQRIERDLPLPTGAWRSVGASQNAFMLESFVDELAHAAGEDPLSFRLQLLEKASPRYRGVLALAAEKANWGHPPAGRSQGVALYHSFRSWAAYVVEASVSPANKITVHRIVGAIDCGRVVNPDTVKAQVEGAAIFALTAALKGEINLDNGHVVQSNYHDYRLLTMAETPEIEVHIVSSDEAPTGVGEPGVPPLAPAVANAVFAATGKRIRKLPMESGLLSA